MQAPAMTLCSIAFAVLASVPFPQLGAQPVQRRRVLPELRADFSAGEVSSGHIAAGVHVSTGTYVRFAFLGGVGRAWHDDVSGNSYRLEVQGRFHLDPFRNARFGLYGIGGVVSSHDPFADWQSRLVLGAGVDLPAHGRATWAIETAFAGGFRVSIVTRRLPLGQR